MINTSVWVYIALEERSQMEAVLKRLDTMGITDPFIFPEDEDYDLRFGTEISIPFEEFEENIEAIEGIKSAYVVED